MTRFAGYYAGIGCAILVLGYLQVSTLFSILISKFKSLNNLVYNYYVGFNCLATYLSRTDALILSLIYVSSGNLRAPWICTCIVL